EHYLRLSETVPGWTRGCEARELWRVCYSLPLGATIVEIGSFLGSGTILLAGACRTRGSGLVHCVDPFDGRGDSFSVPYYQTILAELGTGSLRTQFESNVRECGLAPWVRIHSGPAQHVGRSWTTPIDLIFFDGDQSPAGVRMAYGVWIPFLKIGGVIALHNSDPVNRRPDH